MAANQGKSSETKPHAETRPKVESKPIVENKPGENVKAGIGKIWILVGTLSLLTVLSLALLAFTYFRGRNPVSAIAGDKNKLATKATAPQESKSEKAEVKATLALDPFLVNLADKEQVRFVKVTFQLGLAEEPNERTKSPVAMAAIRDAIISLLSSKTAEQILTTPGKDKLREEIRTRVNAVAPKMKVLEVYIVDFVVQL
jgi:flagellar FliL protein